MAHNGGRVLKNKITQRHRKSLLVLGDVHPDVEDALAILLGNEPAALNDEELAEAQAIIEEGLDQLGEGENDPDASDSEDEDEE
jgi:hypothetical protein